MFVFKIICLVLFTLCAIASLIVPKIVSEKKYPNNAQRVKLIVRIRMGLFLGMLVFLFLCVVLN